MASSATALSALLLCLAVSGASACSCLPFTLADQFDEPQITRIVKAKLVYQVESPGDCGSGLPGAPCAAAKIYYVFRQIRAYKGCAAVKFFVAQTTPLSSCGTFLTTGKKYVLALGSAAVPELGLCGYIRDVDFLSQEDRVTLRERDQCAGGY